MSATSDPAPAPNDYAALLDALIQTGARLVRKLETEAPRPGQDIAADYERFMRAIRRSILLIRHLAEPTAAQRAQQQAEQQAAQRAHHRTEARKRIIRRVEDAIKLRAAPHEADCLRAELRERLESPEIEDDVVSRPVPDIIADICRDLHVAPSFNNGRAVRRTQDDIRLLCALAASPPLATPEFPPGQAARGAVLRHESLARSQR